MTSGHPLTRWLDKDLESYGRAAWAARTVVRNVVWLRNQGGRALVEEHELHPLRRVAAAANRASWRRACGGRPGDAVPVFLVGIGRSGTNMMARALATSPELEVHNDGDRRAFHHYRLRSDDVVRQLVLRSRHRFVVFKPLIDTPRACTLLDGLGSPRRPLLLWAYRDVDGRVRSSLTKFGDAERTALADIAAGRGASRWHAVGMSPQTLEILRSVDWPRATAADGAALLWYAWNALFFEFALDRRDDVLPVSYDALVRAPEPVMRKVCAFLGATWRPEMVAGIEQRSDGRRGPVPLQPMVREVCDSMTARLVSVASAGADP